MPNAITSANLGMRAAALRLQASARNVANAGSPGAPSANAARIQPVYVLTRIDQSGLAAPVASGATPSVRNAAPLWMADAGAGNADMAHEALEQADARISFLANAKTLEVAQEMVKRLFELADGD